MTKADTPAVPRRQLRATLAIVFSLVGLLALLVASPAKAAPVTYELSMVFSNSPQPDVPIIGTFDFDASACASSPCPTAYSNVSLTQGPITGLSIPEATYVTADVCNDGVDPCNTFPVSSGASVLHMEKLLPGSLFIAANIKFGTPLTNGEPSLDVSGSELYSEFGPFTGSSGSLKAEATPVPPATAALTVNARAASSKLSKGKNTTVVKSASVSPTNAGKVSSIKVSCRSLMRGDVSYCTSTKNLATGKVTVTTHGRAKLTVKVTIKTTSSSPSYQGETWTRQWKTK